MTIAWPARPMLTLPSVLPMLEMSNNCERQNLMESRIVSALLSRYAVIFNLCGFRIRSHDGGNGRYYLEV